MRIAACCLLSLLALVTDSRRVRAQAGTLDTVAVRQWREDLAFLGREMPLRHANLFHQMGRAQFDSALASSSARLPALTRAQAIVEIERLDAMVGDGHSNVSPWRDTVVGFHTLPIALYRFQGGYYVRAATIAHSDLLGARVRRIGKVSIDSAEALVAGLISHDNALGIWMYAPILLQMPEVLHALGLTSDPSQAAFGLEVKGVFRTIRLNETGLFPNLSGEADKSWNSRPGWVDLRDSSPSPLWLSRTRDSYWFAYVPEGRILYCQINEIYERAEPLKNFFARAFAAADSAGAERFVVDLRLNGGGDGYFNKTIVRSLIKSRFDDRGRLFVITGRRTFSAAQMLISDLEDWTNPTFVGEPSSSRGNQYGDSKKLILPNSKITVRVSSLWWQYWDTRDTRPWISPEIAAPLTVDAYRAGRDPALEAIARSVVRPTLREIVKPLLLGRDSVGAIAAVNAYRADPLNAWFDPARIVRLLEMELQGEGRTDAADLAHAIGARLPQWSMPR